VDAEILTYSRARGAFAGLTLNGASIRHDEDSTRAAYGHNVSNARILKGAVTAPPSANSFLNAVRGAKAQAVASK
jgi:SH3 domain-containing YSC84-like protein 1